jgi:hypothetical protein
MQLGETIATYDVTLALRGESGKFEVTSPAGEIYHVTCKLNQSITNLECSENKSEAQPFLIRKVAEPVSMEPGKTMPSGALESGSQPKPARTPFLIENQEAVLKPSGGDAAQLPDRPAISNCSTRKATPRPDSPPHMCICRMASPAMLPGPQSQ